jgi:hypothetical protein
MKVNQVTLCSLTAVEMLRALRIAASLFVARLYCQLTKFYSLAVQWLAEFSTAFFPNALHGIGVRPHRSRKNGTARELHQVSNKLRRTYVRQ